jgi:hypothetical protein
MTNWRMALRARANERYLLRWLLFVPAMCDVHQTSLTFGRGVADCVLISLLLCDAIDYSDPAR